MDARSASPDLCHVLFHAAVLALILIGLSPGVNNARADGSRDLIAHGGNRPFLEGGYGRRTAGIDRLNRFFVYVRAGEKMQLGSSAFSIYQGDILYTRPNGDSGSCSTGRPDGAPDQWGRIQSIDEERAGPLPAAGGYTPCELDVDAASEGIWQITFIGPQPESYKFSKSLPGGATWIQASDVYTVAAWDISVRNANDAVLAGRVFAHHLPLNLGDADASLTARYRILTRDGYDYAVDMNGTRGHTLLLFSSPDGFIRSTTKQPAYRSIILDEVNTANKGLPDGIALNDPLLLDGLDAAAHKLFFDQPASDLPAAAESAYGPMWLRTAPTQPADASQFSYSGGVGKAGSFSFQASTAGRYQITVDLDNNGIWGDGVDVMLSGMATTGLNLVSWDGRDGFGQLAPGIHGGYRARLVTVVGEAHLPLFDIENRAGGIIVERPGGGFNVHYDDALLAGRSGGPETGRNSGGADSRYGAHAFREGYGDAAGIDTWMQVESAPILLDTPLLALQNDLRLELSVDETAPSIGQTVHVTAELSNDGPDAAALVRSVLYVPEGLNLLSTVPEFGAFESGSGQWVVEDLAAGQSARITFSLAASAEGGHPIYTQIVEHLGDDPDSSPNNFNVLLPGDHLEDDADATAIYADPAPAIGIAQRIVEVTGDLSRFEATVEFRVENLGNTPLTGLQIKNNLQTAFSGTDFRVVNLTAVAPLQVNQGYNGKSEINLLDSGASRLEVGEAATVTCIVSVTPFTAFGPYELSAEGYGFGANDSIVNDISDDGLTSDSNGNGSAGDVGENDPTRLSIPHRSAIGLALDALEVKGAATDFTARIRLVVENLGDAPLHDVQSTLNLESIFGSGRFTVSNLSAEAPLVAMSTYDGGAISRLLNASASSLKAGQKATISFDLHGFPQFSIGYFNLRGRASALGIDGAEVTDLSDGGQQTDPSGNGFAGDSGEDDVTVISFDAASPIGAALTTSRVTGDLGGFTAYYSLKIQNLGGDPLFDVGAIQDLETVFAGSVYSVSNLAASPSINVNPNFDGLTHKNLLAAGNTLNPYQTVTVTYAVTVDPRTSFGPYRNFVVVNADGENGSISSDFSDSGVEVDADHDGNPNEAGENDPTVTAFAHNGRIGSALAVSQMTGDMTAFGLTYTVVVENMGDVPLSSPSLVQDLASSLAGTRYEVVSIEADEPFVVNSLFDGDRYQELLDPASGVLEIGQKAMVTVSLSVAPVDAFGPFSIQAEAAGSAPIGTRLSDLSTDGLDPDPNQNGDPTENAPTRIRVDERPVIGVSMGGSRVQGDLTEFIARYIIRLENLGDVPLENVQINFPATEVFEGAEFEVLKSQAYGSLSPNDAFDGHTNAELLDADASRLSVADTSRIVIDIRVRPQTDYGPYLGNAIASARGPAGAFTTDASDEGYVIDSNNNGVPNEKEENEPTRISVASRPAIGVAKTLNRVEEVQDGYAVEVETIVKNLGDVPLTNLELIEDVDASFSGAYVEIKEVALDESSALSVNSAFNGVTDKNVLAAGGAVIAPGSETRILMELEVHPEGEAPIFESRALARAAGPDGASVEDWSNDGADPDPNGNGLAGDEGEDTPTLIRLYRRPSFRFEPRLDAVRGDSAHFNARFSIVLANDGELALEKLQVDFDLVGLFGNASTEIQQANIVTGPTVALNPSFDGELDLALLDVAKSRLSPGQTAHITLDVSVTASGSYGPYYGRMEALVRAEEEVLTAIAEIPPIRVSTSSGYDAGLESNGNLAGLVASRAYARRNERPGSSASQKLSGGLFRLMGAESVDGRGGLTLQESLDLIPSEGPENAEAVTTTPLDLFGVTNATSVLAVDYMKDGRRLAGLFSTTTPAGETYEHSKNICDRLQGASLKGIERHSINGYPFVLSVLEHPWGQVDYAVSLVGYRRGDGFLVDSRFVRDDYKAPAGAIGEVLNFQVWSYSPSYTIALVTDILERMEAVGAIDFVSREDDVPDIPDLYVEKGTYRQGSIVLQVRNGTGASELRIAGETSLVEGGAKKPFETFVTLPADLEESESFQVVVPSGVVYDALLDIRDAAGESSDQIYLADGAWGRVIDDEPASTVESFQVLEQEPYSPHEDRLIVERGVRFRGEVTSRAVIFRHFKPGGQELDLSEYEYVTFIASGQGRIRVQLEEAGDGGDHFFAEIDLTASPKRHTIYYRDFAKRNGGHGFGGAETTAISFVFEAGDEPVDIDFLIHDLLFGRGSPVGVENESLIPVEYSLAQNFPNPFNPHTAIQFGLPEPARVRLEVYDMLGRRVTTVVDQEYSPGMHTVNFDAGRLASGSYVYRLVANERVFSKMMHVVK